MAFDEVVLRAFLQRLRSHQLVVQAGQHHQRDAGCGGVGPADSFQSLRIDQTKIEQNNIDRMRREMPLGVAQTHHMRQSDIKRAMLVEHHAEQTGVSGIILDQENCV